MTDILAQATQVAVGSVCLLIVAALVGRAAMTGVRVAGPMLAGVIALTLPAASPSAAAPEIRVLILNAADPYLPAYVAIDAAMRETLAREKTRKFTYFLETLDAQRYDWKQYETELLSLLVKKYRGRRIDVVVAITRSALEFADDHGKELWPDARIVFHSIAARAFENVVLPANVTGVVTRANLGGTLDLARRLQPRARRMLVIAGLGDIDQSYLEEARKELAARPQTAEVEFLLGLPQPELEDRVKREAADSIILYLAQYRDRDGRTYLPREVLHAISAVSPAPIYGPTETFVGSGGIAGGVVESYVDRGRIVAEHIIAASAGKSPSPVLADGPAHCVVDAGALRRWSLDEANLPEGCEVRFAERPFWREYPLQTFGALSVLLIQAGLIAVLLVERRRRHAAELELRRRLLEVVHLNRTAAVGVLSASVAHELTQPLGAIQSYAEAAEVYLKTDPTNIGRVETILAAIRRDDERAVGIIRRLRGLYKKSAEIELQDFDLNDAIQAAIDILEPEATKRSVELSVERSPVALRVRADPVQVQQVILNLALNAMDATQGSASGERRIAIKSALSGTAEVEVLVMDSGTGIAKDKLTAVFEPFYSTKPQGTGLGLSISRAIVEANRGRIWAENRPDGGAAFYFTLPMAAAIAS